MSMNEFLRQVVDHAYKPKIAQNIATTIAVTALSNLISLPFGRVSFAVSRPKTKDEIRTGLERKLYGAFKTGLFEDSYSKFAKNKTKTDYIAFLDSMSPDYKMKVLSAALQSPKEYLDFVNSESWRQRKVG